MSTIIDRPTERLEPTLEELLDEQQPALPEPVKRFHEAKDGELCRLWVNGERRLFRKLGSP